LHIDLTGKLQVGIWRVYVNVNNAILTKFGRTVGFTFAVSGDTWDMGDIKFEPLTTKATS
jgi:hypothetical protein